MTVCAVLCVSAWPTPAGATGDRLYVADPATIFEVDLLTGDRTILSASTAGTGPELIGIVGMDVEPGGSLVVALSPTEYFWSPYVSLLRVDPTTGDRTLVSAEGVGSGSDFVRLRRIRVDQDGTLLATDFGFSGVFRVDPVTGDRSLVTSTNYEYPVGSGPDMFYYRGIGVEADRSIILTSFSSQALLRVNPLSGNRAIFSDLTHGTGPTLEYTAGGIAIDDDGTILVPEFYSKSVLRVHPVTGDRTIVTGDPLGADVGSGPNFVGDMTDIVILSSGALLVTDAAEEIPSYIDDSLRAVLRVDPATGDRSILSDATHGSGPMFMELGPRSLAVRLGTTAVGAEIWTGYR